MALQNADPINCDESSKLETPGMFRRKAKSMKDKAIFLCSHQAEGHFCSLCGRAKPLNL